MSELHIKGLSELNKFLQELPVKIEKNVLRGSLRAGMNVVKPVAQRNIHSVSGLLAKGLKVRTNARGGKVTASLRTTGPHAWIARFVEFGTRAHRIPKLGQIANLFFGGRFAKSVDHPGAKPHPFLRPALDSEAGRATVAAGEYMKQRLESRHGLDTAYIEIEEG